MYTTSYHLKTNRTYIIITHHLTVIGCAKGSWGLKYAQTNVEKNVLGLEIRKPVVDLALRRKYRWSLENIHFLSCNANVDLNYILNTITHKDSNSTNIACSSSSIEMVLLQFPDPHFKTKHKKRRVVNEELIVTIARHIDKDAVVFMQSDILDLIEDMVSYFAKSPYFRVTDGYDINNLSNNSNPTGLQTEREIATINKNELVYRMSFSKV